MKRTALIIMAMTMGILCLNAQGIRETRVIKTTALHVYDKYISAVNGLGEKSGYSNSRFLELFEDGMDSLCNDILPDIYPDMLSPEQYVEKYSKWVRKAYYSYSNFKMGEPFSNNDKWNIYCTFECDVQYVDRMGVSFPSHRFKYSMRIVMDKRPTKNTLYENRYIASLTISNPVNNFVVVHNPSGSITLNGGTQRNNAGDYWVGEIGKTNIKSLQSESLNPFFKTSYNRMPEAKNRYEQVSQSVDVAGFGIYYTPFELGNKLDGCYDEMKIHGNMTSLRAFWGKNLAGNDNETYFVNIGLELYRKNCSASGNYENHYASVDIDGDNYQRNIIADLNKESITSYGLRLPLSFSYLLALNDPSRSPLFFSVEAGVSLSYKAISVHTFDMSARYTGLYNYFGGIEFDHYYDYGNYELNQDNTSTDFKEQVNKFDVMAMLGVGIWYGITDESFLRFDISLVKGFVSEMKYNDNLMITNRFDDYHSVFQSSKQGSMNLFAGISYIINLK